MPARAQNLWLMRIAFCLIAISGNAWTQTEMHCEEDPFYYVKQALAEANQLPQVLLGGFDVTRNGSPVGWVSVVFRDDHWTIRAEVDHNNYSKSFDNLQDEQAMLKQICTQGISSSARPLPMATAAGIASSPTGQAAQSFFAEDVNGDGIADTVEVFTSRVTVTLGKPDGTPGIARSYTVGPNAYFGLAGDFNGDGKIDLAISNNGNSQGSGSGVSILLGNGDGTFQAAKSVAINGNPFSIAAADFNGDGKLDVAVTDDLLGLIWVLLGNGDGTLQTPVSYPSGTIVPFLLNPPGSILAADFNNDGKPDLVTYNFGVKTVSVLLGRGDGTFLPAVISPGGAGGFGYLTYADLNHDGKLDLAVAHQDSDSISLLLGNGDGTFQPAKNYVVGNSPDSLSLIPLDDGSFMVFTPDPFTVQLRITLSPGDGTLAAPALYPIERFLGPVAAADLNGDGIPDVIASGSVVGAPATVDVMLTGKDGSLGTPARYDLPNFGGAGSPQSLATGDLNGDGKPDVVAVGGGDSGYLDVLLGVGDGTLAAARAFAVGSRPTAVTLADFNGDGKLDAAVANTGTPDNSGVPGSVSVLFGNGDGTFAKPVDYSPGPLHPASLAAADFNGDGKPDLAVVTNTIFNTTPIVPSSIVILLNKGDGTFQQGPALQIDSTIQAAVVAAGDLNGDGKIDLAVGAFEEQGPGDGVAIFLGNGDGTFSQGTFVTTGEPFPVNVAITDLDQDGKADLVVNFSDATYLLGNGDGTFQAEKHITSGVAPRGLAVTDFNADGLPDLVFADAGGSVVALANHFPIVSGSCAYFITPSGIAQTSAGGSLTISIQAGSTCGWTVAGLPAWITTASALTGSGAATIAFTVAPNSGGPRSATMNVSGRLITVTQAAAGCGFGLSVGGQAFVATGGAGSLSVTANPGCGWTASGAPAWVTFTSGSGNGNGLVSYTVAANAGADRTATFTIAGIAYTIQQEAASISGLSFIGSLAHLAADENWTTTFTLVNKAAPATARLSLFGDAVDPSGNGPLAVPLAFPQQTGSSGPLLAASFDQPVAANASLIVATAGPQMPPVLVGSAQLAATGAVDGFAIFHQIVTTQEAVVPMETRNASSYLLAFDNTNGLVLGVAVENISAQNAVIPVVIRDDTGVVISAPGASISLGGNGHTAFVLSDPAPGFPVTANNRGTIEFDTPAGGQISVLGLRFTPPNNALTTIPALANVGTGGGSIAHLASGGDGWQTTFVLVNTGTSSAQFTLSFFADQTGAPLSLPLAFPQPNAGADTVASSVTQNLAAGATRVIVSSGAPQLLTGSAQVTTAGHISGFVIFRHNNQEAVVPLESRNAAGYIVAFDNTNGTATGIAVNAVSAGQVNIPVTVRDASGATIATDTITLNANGHYAFTLVTDRYPATANIRGTIEFDTPPGAQIGALGIRIPNVPAHTYTTLPALAK